MQNKNKNNVYAPLLIELSNNNMKTSLMEKIKSNGPINPGQLNITNSTKNIFIHDFLTDQNKNLFKEVRNLKQQLKLNFVWYKNGFVYARQTETSKVFRISSTSDISSLMNEINSV